MGAQGSLVIENVTLSTPLPEQGSWQVVTTPDAYVVIEGGIISEVGKGTPPRAESTLDGCGRAAIPALCDPHTHAIFAGWRAREFEMRLTGKGYKEILAAGGGILDTVSATREASGDDLARLLRRRLDAMLSRGVLTCEVKSGYGLDVDTEIRMLKAISEAGKDHPVDVVSTFLGAHAVPGEWSGDGAGYIEEVVVPLIGAIARRGLAEFVDVFCEPGAFSVAESRRVLEAATGAGLGLRIHADELEASGGAALAAEMGCASAEHLLSAPPDQLLQMRDAGVTAVLLPGTALVLGQPYAQGRWMVDQGMSVALGSDFNPGSSPIIDMGLIMVLACLQMKMTPAEVLVAATRNAAMSLGRRDRGVVAPGYRGDLVILDAPQYTHLMYRPGARLVSRVISAGDVVFSEDITDL